jgi:hypothetical protein
MMYPSNSPWSPYLPAPVTSEEGPAPARQQGLWSGRYAHLTGIVIIAITVLAIVAAVVGVEVTAQVSSTAAPSSWTKVFAGTLDNTTQWNGDGGCDVATDGLDVTGISGSDVCTFTPSTSSDLVSSGFQLNLKIAPEIRLYDALTPLVQVSNSHGDGFSLIFDDTGNFVICQYTSADCAGCLGASLSCNDTVLVSDSTVAWHTNPYVGNDLEVRYQQNLGSDGTLTVFVSGQQIADTTIAGGLGQGVTLAIGAGDGGEALFTGAALYTASPPLSDGDSGSIGQVALP